jgi:hypothetical protein
MWLRCSRPAPSCSTYLKHLPLQDTHVLCPVANDLLLSCFCNKPTLPPAMSWHGAGGDGVTGSLLPALLSPVHDPREPTAQL